MLKSWNPSTNFRHLLQNTYPLASHTRCPAWFSLPLTLWIPRGPTNVTRCCTEDHQYHDTSRDHKHIFGSAFTGFALCFKKSEYLYHLQVFESFCCIVWLLELKVKRKQPECPVPGDVPVWEMRWCWACVLPSLASWTLSVQRFCNCVVLLGIMCCYALCVSNAVQSNCSVAAITARNGCALCSWPCGSSWLCCSCPSCFGCHGGAVLPLSGIAVVQSFLSLLL